VLSLSLLKAKCHWKAKKGLTVYKNALHLVADNYLNTEEGKKH
jgi:hypothetical protein